MLEIKDPGKNFSLVRELIERSALYRPAKSRRSVSVRNYLEDLIHT